MGYIISKYLGNIIPNKYGYIKTILRYQIMFSLYLLKRGFRRIKVIYLSVEPVPYLMDCLASYPIALIFNYNVKLLRGY